jgi:hypothetical protein
MKTQTAGLCAVRRQGSQPAHEKPGRSGMGLGVADHQESRTWVRLGALDKDRLARGLATLPPGAAAACGQPLKMIGLQALTLPAGGRASGT